MHRHFLFFSVLSAGALSREITFPPVAGSVQDYTGLPNQQALLNTADDGDEHAPLDGALDLTGSKFGGLTTYANIPYVHCLSDGEVEKFDIAVLGAPFDTVRINRHCLEQRGEILC